MIALVSHRWRDPEAEDWAEVSPMRRPRHQSDPKCLWAGIQEEVGIHPSKTQLAVELLKMKITFSFNVLKYLRVKHLPYCNCRG